MMIDQILELGFELDPWGLNNLMVFMFESLFVSKETLVLASTLNCSSSAYEFRHLFEDLAGSLF